MCQAPRTGTMGGLFLSQVPSLGDSVTAEGRAECDLVVGMRCTRVNIYDWRFICSGARIKGWILRLCNLQDIAR